MAQIIGTNRPDNITPMAVSDGVSGGTATQFSDWISSGNGDDRIEAANGDDTIYAGNGNDEIGLVRGGDSGNDFVDLGNGADTVHAEGGNDTVFGGRGEDLIYGGFGTDLLYGGPGGDVFAFGSVRGSRSGSFYAIDSGVGEGQRDVISDYQQGPDIIDLELINSIGPMAPPRGPIVPGSDRAFSFIGTDEFTGVAAGGPELRYYVLDGITIIQMDGIYPGSTEPDGVVDA
jgi:hypothetical protein